MNLTDAVKLLNLKVPFTPEIAKKSYRRLALKTHPDHGGDAEKMKRINEAFELCSKGITFGPAPKINLHGVEFKPIKRKPSLYGLVSWFGSEILKCIHDFAWRDNKAETLYSSAIGKCVNLRANIENKDKNKIIASCAEIAAYMMMIADNARKKL